MKNKKIYIIVTIVVITLGLYYYFMLFRGRKVELSVHQAGNFTEYKSELPDFEILAGGIVNATINLDVLKANGVVPYEFEAYEETNWGNIKNKYIGYKLTDILSIFKTKDYKSIIASNVGGIRASFSINSIDNVFMVFYRNGDKIADGKCALISVSDNENYTVEKLYRIDLSNMEVK